MTLVLYGFGKSIHVNYQFASNIVNIDQRLLDSKPGKEYFILNIFNTLIFLLIQSSSKALVATPGKNEENIKLEVSELVGTSHGVISKEKSKTLEDVKMEAAANIDRKQEPATRIRALALAMEDEPEYDDTLCILDWCKFVFIYLFWRLNKFFSRQL